MSKRYQLQIPATLTKRETEAVMEVLEDVIDLLCRHLHELDRHAHPDHRDDWAPPPWAQPPNDTP